MAKKKEKRKVEKTETEEKKQSKKLESQVKWVIFGMIALILVVAVAYFIAQESKKISYGGLEYEKIDYSKSLSLYHTEIPLRDAGGNLVANYNLYLRNNPQDLKDIILSSPIQLKENTIVSLDEDSEIGCDDSGIAGANFLSFLKTAGIKVSVAYSEESYAKEKNANYVTCETDSNESIILIKKGEENKITQETPDCFVLQYKDCEILKPTERFMVALYANSKGIQV